MANDDPYLDPTDSVAVPRKMALRPPTVEGKVIGLLDISKPKGSVFLDRIEELLKEMGGVKAVVRRSKPTYTRPAPEELREALGRECDLLIEALAD